MRSWLFFGVCGAIAAAQGCGSGNATSGSSSASSASGTSSSVGDASSGSASSTSSGGTGGSSSASTSTASSTSTSGTGGAAACPDVLGAYKVTEVGLGCGDLDLSASECIKGTNVACQVTLVSKAGVQGTGVDGTVDLDMTGAFMNGMIKLGSVQRSGCTGTWNAATSQMAVNCGGMNPSSQMCTATLTRTGIACSF